MLNKKIVFGSLASLGLLFGVAANPAVAAENKAEINQFQRIEQPLWVKGAVTAGGLALIGLEIWWFLGSKPKSQTATASNGIQEVNITVDGGYEPSRVVVNAGQLVRLNFLRRDPSSCLEAVILPDFHIAKNLELNRITPVEFTPQKPGQYTFACGMNMFRGIVEVKAVESSKMGTGNRQQATV